ncbi:aminoacyl-tRNA hydrolase [Myroides sp. 1354]|uniref:alternative ribosome rescue aminoacyl-tRNA hydrolase ArfB n=1 Tax=unclassified Myroides TaxID=2642485 RepID=UPI00257761B1|nr:MULTISPECIES: alternative ribosome rescue aminoacyl-tRNA hydrolase ArfB [unclassified Myroides]MDM1044037.1 aminoacyl-tRNA hydrolase [Myroides sp. R163-1]MDM1054972.1 aminoacyl-tRNA hydrolase [Myroides sp. 1354]MDM1068269.1 aminoacyl-tRNA hydrolase [Myroides sp. 1372]
MDKQELIRELTFKAVRSGGAGGQHVNKVSSKVVLFWNLATSTVFNEEDKNRLFKKLNNYISKEGVLILSAEETRSQIKNKELVIQKLIALLKVALVQQKIRKETKVPKSVIRKNQENKKKLSLKKELRKRII